MKTDKKREIERKVKENGKYACDLERLK